MTAATIAPSEAQLKQLLEETETIAVVGWSDRKERPSHEVATYLRKQGYRVIPVNPRLAGKRWDRQPIFATISDIPGRVDLVDVFRRPEYTPAHAEDAVAAGAKVFWLHLGIVNDEAGRIAGRGGLTFVQDKCTQIEYLRLMRGIAMPAPPVL